MTPEEIAANADALQQAFGKLGITPEMAFMEEGRSLAGDRYNNALQRAMELGMNGRVAAIQSKIERDATTHTRREMLRLARAGTAGERPTAAPVPANLPSSGQLFQGIQQLGGAPAGPQMPERPNPLMLPTLSGVENREPPLPPAPHREIGRMIAQTGGGIAGGVGGGLVGGIPGAIAGGGFGSAGAGQAYDAAADWLMNTQERPPVMSGSTARDFAAGAIPGAGPYVGSGLRVAGQGAANLAAAAASRPTVNSLLASGALGGAALTATPGETQAPIEIPRQFQPMDRNEFFRQNRASRRSLEEMQTEAEARVMANPAYQELASSGQRTAAKRMIDQARANAKTTFDTAEAGRAGEEARLEQAYNAYKAGLKTDLDAYFSGRAAEEQAAKDRLANTPFRQRHPIWAEALPAAGFAVAAGVPFTGRLTANLLDQTAPRVEAAIQRARTTADPREFQMAVDELNNALASRPPRVFDQPSVGAGARVAAQAAWPAAKAGLAGGPVVSELSMLPDQIDAMNLPDGPARERAREAALNPVAYGERALLGGAAAAGGYKLPDVLPWPRRPNWPQAQAAARLPPPSGGGGGANNPSPGGGGGSPPPRVPPPTAGGPPHGPGTTYVNPRTGERRFMDVNGRWQGPLPSGGHGWTSEPPASWERISQVEPTNLLLG